MLTLIEFTDIIRNIQEHENFCKKVSDEYPIDIYQINEVFSISRICDIFFLNLYGEENCDKINYWLYEDEHCFTATNEEIEELYNMINV